MWGFQTVKGMTNRDDSKLNKLRASQGRFGEKLLPITEERPGVPMGPTYKPSKVSTQAALTPNLAALTLIEMLERAEREVTTGRMKVLWVLELLPGVGNVRARRLMEIMDISDSQTLRGLSVLQSNHLVVAMDDPDWAQTVMQTSVASQTPQNSQETMSSETLKRYEAIINDVINDVIELVVPPKEPKPPISAATTTTHNVFGSPASRESKKVTRPTNWVTKTDGLPPSMRWDPNHWRVCKECGSRTRWRNASGDAVCQQCMFKQ